ncbi:methyltransferase domain-containing protein [bacterium SCSIO 12741]|nr:methyltransferase domain-containing protein [bacterium SCSIO 12741]
MNTKDHYEHHLAHFYSWMAGDFETKSHEFEKLLNQLHIRPKHNKQALDLGAGHGIQSVALGQLGFEVIAVDFNEQLLQELRNRSEGLPIKTVLGDIKEAAQSKAYQPEVIACCGDTLTHLENKAEIHQLIGDCNALLSKGGHLILSFRDYSNELKGEQRFIPVKSDDTRILTCLLEYQNQSVRVTDLLHEKTESGWIQKVSSYQKVRVAPAEVEERIKELGLAITHSELMRGMHTLVAVKPG